jgi:hypothetical protein
MGAARKFADKLQAGAKKVLRRVLGYYRKLTGEEVRAKIRKDEEGWWVKLPLSWTRHHHRIINGRSRGGYSTRF